MVIKVSEVPAYASTIDAAGSSQTSINFYKKRHHSSESHNLNIYFPAGISAVLVESPKEAPHFAIFLSILLRLYS